VLLTRPTPCRQTPIRTTALRFSLCLDAEDAVRVRLIGQRLPHRETHEKIKTR
jgi:hypothetical protein